MLGNVLREKSPAWSKEQVMITVYNSVGSSIVMLNSIVETYLFQLEIETCFLFRFQPSDFDLTSPTGYSFLSGFTRSDH